MEDLGDDARMKISVNTMPFLQKMEANDQYLARIHSQYNDYIKQNLQNIFIIDKLKSEKNIDMQAHHFLNQKFLFCPGYMHLLQKIQNQRFQRKIEISDLSQKVSNLGGLYHQLLTEVFFFLKQIKKQKIQRELQYTEMNQKLDFLVSLFQNKKKAKVRSKFNSPQKQTNKKNLYQRKGFQFSFKKESEHASFTVSQVRFQGQHRQKTSKEVKYRKQEISLWRKQLKKTLVECKRLTIRNQKTRGQVLFNHHGLYNVIANDNL